MANLLWPITKEGSTDRDSDLLLYQPRQFYGVDVPIQNPTDATGPNEIFSFLRRVFDFNTSEHFANGVHKTFRIPQGVLWCGVGEQTGAAPNIVVQDQSYVRDASGNVKIGKNAFSVTRATLGTYNLTFGYAMPSASWAVEDMTLAGGPDTTHPPTRMWRHCWVNDNVAKTSSTGQVQIYGQFGVTVSLMDASFVLAIWGS